jgi:hypothetical protein
MQTTAQKTVFIRKNFNLKQEQDEILQKIAEENNVKFSDILRGFLDDSIKFHYAKRRRAMRFVTNISVAQLGPNFTPPVLEEPVLEDDKKGATGFCQMTGCGREVNRKKLHPFRLNLEVLYFCDTCYFTGEFKVLIRQIL